MPSMPQVLRPFDKREALTVQAAADIADRSVETIRAWCERHAIGRKVGGTWAVSRVALAMFLDDDPPALRAYLGGDRMSEGVVRYFHHLGLTTLCPARAEGQESGKSGNIQERQEAL